MEDILKALVSSRQQGNAGGSGDPMANLLGGLMQGAQNVNLSDGLDAGDVAGLLGGLMGASQPQPQAAGGVSGMMGMLEAVMGGGQAAAPNNPITAMLQPFVEPLAKKAKIPPEIAMIVVSFVVHKLLAHHPQSGRDSREFNLEEMLGQINSGKIDSELLKKSGMVKELSKRAGLDEAAAESALQNGFLLVGKSAASMLGQKK